MMQTKGVNFNFSKCWIDIWIAGIDATYPLK